MIEIAHLHKRLGTTVAVGDVSFRADDGCVTGLLGPNGAGKTTTLRMLSGLMTADAGTVTVDGVDVGANAVAARRRMGVLPDSRGLYPRLTTLEHVEYFGELHGLTRDALRARATQLVEDLDLDSLMHRRVAGFSQGERTKVALARALIHDPRNVILDEPTNGLDVASARSMRSLITRLRDEGRCVLLSSHVMPEVSALCDRIIVIVKGTVVCDGSPDALRERTGCSDLEEAFVALVGDAGHEEVA